MAASGRPLFQRSQDAPALLGRLLELTQDDDLAAVDADPELNERLMQLRSLGYVDCPSSRAGSFRIESIPSAPTAWTRWRRA